MALSDLEVFIREKMAAYNDGLDTTPGSSFDSKVMQPILQRLGTDPYTLDIPVFLQTILQQAYPDLAQGGDDTIVDLLIKPAMVILDPILREQQRIKAMSSLANPNALTTDEADALGANFFSSRNLGDFAKGQARIYYAQPQPEVISARNFVTSKSGLQYFPTSRQSVTAEQMILNKEGDLYFFDIDLIAAAAGDEYSIEPDQLATIALLTAPVRITNKNRFRFGLPAEDAGTYIARLDKEVTERSMVTQRGIVARTAKLFPEVTRLASVGFNDPEMQRDVITGGSLGTVLADGLDGTVVSDGEFKPLSRRFYSASASFETQLAPSGPVTGFVLTLVDAYNGALPRTRDLFITRVLDNQTLEVKDQVLYPGANNKVYTVRKRELLLSSIPGGIVAPTGPNGTVSIEPDKIHVGGCFDADIRGVDQDVSTLVIDVASDDEPELNGVLAGVVVVGSTLFKLFDLSLGGNYEEGDATWQLLEDAKKYQHTLEVLTGAVAGVYRIIDVFQVNGSPPVVQVDPNPLSVSTSLRFRWRIITEIDIDLVEPKETRLRDTNGITVQNSDFFTTGGGINFDGLGVAAGDILRLNNGLDKGDFEITEVVPPGFTTLTLNRPALNTGSNLSFSIFRKNLDDGIFRPLLRIRSVELLDTTGQPVGTKVPYAKPVAALSRPFVNPGVGVYKEVNDAVLGIVSIPEPGGGFVFGAGGNILFKWDGLGSPISVSLTGTLSASDVVDAINTISIGIVNVPLAVLFVKNGQTYVGIIPVGPNTALFTGSTSAVLITLFGDDELRTAKQVRSATVGNWYGFNPPIDTTLDVLGVMTGHQAGWYSHFTFSIITFPLSSWIQTADRDFSPEVAVSVRIGKRSLGTVRLFFLEPTSMEVDASTRFYATDDTGQKLTFLPDYTLTRQVLPALPNGEKSTDGETTVGNTFSSVANDFVREGVRENDVLVIDYVPVRGSVNLVDPVLNLSLKDLVLSLGDTSPITIVFINDVGTPGAVSRSGVASQINSAVGETVCEVQEITPGDFRLVFTTTRALKLYAQVGSPTQANTLLGFSNVSDTTNDAPEKGSWVITQVGSPTINDLQVAGPFSTATTGNQFKIIRTGEQRIVTTQVAENIEEAGLYYWDVEAISEGAGNTWNIDQNVPMEVTNFRSDGYYLTTKDSNYSFSPYEDVALHISKSVLEIGTDDSPTNATTIAGQSLLITYEHSELVSSYQDTLRSDTERVINANPLARHLVPHMVRFTVAYTGEPLESTLSSVLSKYIREVLPDEPLRVSALQRLISNEGASTITNPITLYAVVHNQDRTITMVRSQDQLSVTRLAAFIPDVLNLNRRLS